MRQNILYALIFLLVFSLGACTGFAQGGHKADLKGFTDTDNAAVGKMMDKVYAALGAGKLDLALKRIDSLEQIARALNDPCSLAIAFNARAEFFSMTEKHGPSIPNFKNAVKYYQQCENDTLIYRQYCGLGQAYRNMGELDSALYFLSLADSFHKQHPLIKNHKYNIHHSMKARVYSTIGEFDKSIQSYLSALENAHHEADLAVSYDNLANEYITIEDFELAEEYADKAFELLKGKKGNRLGLNRLRKARIAMERKDYNAAESYTKEALENFKEASYKKRIPHAKTILSGIYLAQGKLDLAKATMADVSESDFDFGNLRYATYITHRIEIAFADNDLASIPALLEKGINSAKSTNRVANLNVLYKLSAKYYKLTGAKEAEAEALRKHLEMNNKLYNIRRVNYAANLEAKYQTAQKEQRIAQLELEEELQEVRLRNQRGFLFSCLFALALLVGFLFLLFRRNKKIRSQKNTIEKSLVEKDILLREIHHRVKNNLQLVSSLLGLQGMATEDQDVKNAINASKSRVRSMALIHQDLYNREKLTNVNVQDYLEKLCQELVSTYRVQQDKVTLKTDIQSLDLDVDTLIPIGLIINELLTNALKYAFPADQEGEITLALYEKQNLLHMSISDNGIGLKEENTEKDSFGFRLIRSLLRQLEGEMEILKGEGTSIKFFFKEYQKSA